MNRIKLLLCLLLLSLGGCRGDKESEGHSALLNGSDHSVETNAYGKYTDPVVLRIGFKVPDSKLNTGDSNDNNPISRYLESITNIKVVHTWEAKGEDTFTQKAQLSIDSNDLPDAMIVNRNQLWMLIDNDMIEDLSQTYKDYGSQLIKDMYESTKGEALNDASRNGKLYGLPNVAINADSPSLLWIRQDWLEKLNLQPPKNLGDIEAIAKAFIDKDPDGNGKRDTVGLSGYKNIVYGTKPHANGLDTLFSSYHSFPTNWIKDSSGNIVYGSITPETKEALAKLANWYKRGLIDPQFALYKETQEPIINGRAGMFFGPWWMPFYPLSEAVALDIKSEWRAYAAPLDVEGKFITHMAPVTDRYLVVRKGYEHPEAAVKLLNAFTRLERRQDPNKEEVRKLDDFSAQTGIQPRAYYPYDLLIDFSDAIEKHYADIQQTLHGKIDPNTLDAETRKLYEQWMAEEEQPKKNMEGWKAVNAYKYGAAILSSTPIEGIRSVFYGNTPIMKSKWDNLMKLETETFLNIIVGDAPISDFDHFVAQWKKLGGDEITKEVTSIVNKK
ncbi:extracellular solute-binding protein [Paenibacillus wynnii]|uniref:extracellular solute-binding protein n=1 Tax=Paenibacillus wynnii TaxID=268407 RepID=UPI00068D6455|nr:extracellular solute-binding protein [Paenibacillus wynnii]